MCEDSNNARPYKSNFFFKIVDLFGNKLIKIIKRIKINKLL